MNRYDSYKDSGIDKIGEIPKYWKSFKLKRLVDSSKYYQIGDGDHGSIKPEMYIEDGEIPYVRVQNLTWKGDFKKDNLVFLTRETHSKNLKSKLLPGDILIAKTGATVGKLCLLGPQFDEYNTTSSVGKVTIDKRYNIPKFYLYFFQSKYFQELIWVTSIQKSAQPGFNIDDLTEFKVVQPEKYEQQKIVEFLDDKISKIDQLIAQKERKIELLKEKRNALINHIVTKGLDPNVEMKDSGVEWIGEMPRNWKRSKLKYEADIFGRIGYRGYTTEDIVDEGNGAITISPSNIQNDKFTIENSTYLSWEKYFESPEIQIFGDDIILVKTGSTIGKTSIIPYNLPEMTINPQLVVLKNIKLNPKYLFYQTTCRFIKESFDIEQTGSTTPTISQEKINDFPILVPPLYEQRELVDFLDSNIKDVDDVILVERNKISLLKEYRQSLIFEVVTGKVKVC